MSKADKTTITVLDQKIIAALGSQFRATATISIGGNVYRAKDLQTQLQAEVDAAKATQSAETAYQQAVLSEEKVGAQAALIRKDLRVYLIGVYGAKSATVAEFGFTPKEATVDVKTKAAAIVKSAATRAARGTMGSRQKKEIKGTVPAAPSSAPSVAPQVNSVTPKTALPS